MSANYKTLSDFEVATAEEAQSYFMDQAIIKVDTSADLTGLPTTVKTAYVMNTGILMARNAVNDWVPMGGVATVSETAPSNPQTGQLWVKPSEVLPAPVRGYMITAPKSITATAYADVTLDTARSITLPKPAMCMWSVSANMSAQSATAVQARLNWSGATSGNTYSQVGGYMGALNSSAPAEKCSISGSVVLGTGTTTFGIEAFRSNTSNTVTVDQLAIYITPVAWADEYVAGVS